MTSLEEAISSFTKLGLSIENALAAAERQIERAMQREREREKREKWRSDREREITNFNLRLSAQKVYGIYPSFIVSLQCNIST
jgi:hypothetical protein